MQQRLCPSAYFSFCNRDEDSIHVNEDNKSDSLVEAIANKRYRRIYLAPEQLQADDIRKLCRDPSWSSDVLAYIIDEAHVVREWGGAFRPVYKTLSDLRHISSRKIPIMTVTATLSDAAYNALKTELQFSSPTIINVGCQRPNIYIQVQPFEASMKSFIDIVKALPELKGLRRGGRS